MKRNLIRIIQYVFIIIFVYGCTEEVDIDLPESEQKIFVNGYLNPGQDIQLSLFYSKPNPLDTSDYKPVDNAEVKIFHKDSLFCELSYNDSPGEYSDKPPVYVAKNVKPRVGKKYRLHVNVPGHKTISAETIVPGNTKIDTVEHQLISRNYSKYIHCNITFQDEPEQKNFYYFNTITHKENDDFYSDDPLFDGEYYLFEIPYLVFNDELINGESYTLGIDLFRTRIDSTIFRLFTITEDCFLYLESVNKQKSKDDFPIEDIEINIPITEPVQIYSNIKNGLGIFAGINESSKTVYFNYDEKKSDK